MHSYSDHTYLELKIIELFMLLMKKTVTEISDDYLPKSQIDVVKHIRDHLVFPADCRQSAGDAHRQT